VASRGVDPARTAFIRNAVDTDRFRPPTIEERTNARTTLGISESKHMVLYAGRFEPFKSVDSLLQAWALLPNTVLEKSVLVLIGKGSAEANLKVMIRSLDLHHTVIIAGAQTDVLEYYWASNLFVFPSRSEGMSNALTEAMACGLPVIVSKIGGNLDLVIDGQNGVTFEPGNVFQLERQLRSMLVTCHKWNKLGSCARETALRSASNIRAIKLWIHLYNQLGIPGREQ